MKKFVALLVCLILPAQALAWTSQIEAPAKDPYVIQLEKKLWSGYSVQSYDLKGLKKDIAVPKQDEPYENSIQGLSKEKTWNTRTFTIFADALKKKDTKRATDLYRRNWRTMSPFMPTCCAFKEYLAMKQSKNGILSLTMAWNGEPSYYFEYVFYKNEKLYSVTGNTKFSEWSENGKAELKYDGKTVKTTKRGTGNLDFWTTVSSWFATPKKDARFLQEYDAFLEKMTTLWK